MNFDFQLFKNKIIYLAPYNDLTIKMYDLFIENNIKIEGFFDLKKSEKNVHSYDENLYYDFVIINSPNYFLKILQNFEKEKIFLLQDDILIDYKSYLNSILNEKKTKHYDIAFLPHNKAHLLDMLPIIYKLKESKYSIVIINDNLYYKNLERNFIIEKIKDIDILALELFVLQVIPIGAFICMNDWEVRYTKDLITYYNAKDIPTIGIIEGITDFNDSDYVLKRNAYQNVRYVLTTGDNDKEYLKNKKNFKIGIPKLRKLWKSKIEYPLNIIVVINLSFLGLPYNNYSLSWLKEVINVCSKLGLNYIISQHPSDKTDLTEFNVSKKDIYSTIKEGSLVISRFSTVLLESVAMGKPAVYFKPPMETVTLYDNNEGAFSIAKNILELENAIKYELMNFKNVRERAKSFLDKQCNISSKVLPETLAARYIKSILKRYQ